MWIVVWESEWEREKERDCKKLRSVLSVIMSLGQLVWQGHREALLIFLGCVSHSPILSCNTHIHSPASALVATLWCQLLSDWLGGCWGKEERCWESWREGHRIEESEEWKKMPALVWVEGFLSRDVRCVCVSVHAAFVPLWSVCELCICILGYGLEKRGDPDTTPSQKHEETHLPANLWLWVQGWTWVWWCVCMVHNDVSVRVHLTGSAVVVKRWRICTRACGGYWFLRVDSVWVGRSIESRCRVVALAHFFTAGCQRDHSATSFCCQQFHLASVYVCKTLVDGQFKILHRGCVSDVGLLCF